MRDFLYYSKRAHKRARVLRWKSRLLFILNLPLIFWYIFGSKKDKKNFIDAQNYVVSLRLSAEIKEIQSSIFNGYFHLHNFREKAPELISEILAMITMLNNLRVEALLERRKTYVTLDLEQS